MYREREFQVGRTDCRWRMGKTRWTVLMSFGERERGKMGGADREIGKTTRLLGLKSFEFMGNRDVEFSGSIMRYLGWPGKNDPWPIT